MGEKARRYIESLKKNNAARAKEERDTFLIEHHFTETVIDENGREKIVPETVTDEEYEILREAFYTDPDQEKKEEKASAGWFPSVAGFLEIVVGVFLFISTESPALAWGILIASVASACVLFALGEIVNGIRQIELSTNINEQTLKEILKYTKASSGGKGNSQEDEVAEICSVESAGEANPSQEISTKCNESCLRIEKEEREKADPSYLITGKQSKENHRQDKPENQPSAKKASSSDEITVIVICIIAILIVMAILVGVYFFLS